MIKLFTQIFLCLLLASTTSAQVPTWNWAKSHGGTGDDAAKAIVTDPLGNSYVTGSFKSSIITFGSYSLTPTLGPTYENYFLTKYDPNGNIIWSKQANLNVGSGVGLSYDINGNVYVMGYFSTNTVMVIGTITVTPSNPGTIDVFIAKYDPNGNCIWAKNIGSSNSTSQPISISSDAAGNVYFVGNCESNSFMVGSTTFTGGTMSNPKNYLAKLDPNGNILWAKTIEGIVGSIKFNAISADAIGNSYLAAEYWMIAPFSIGTSTLPICNVPAVLIVKYDSNGNSLWARGTAGTTSNSAKHVAEDGLGNVYLAGIFSGNITFSSTLLSNAGPSTRDYFITKYDGSGNFLWAVSGGGAGNEWITGIKKDGTGNVYATGTFSSSLITFGSTTYSNSNSSLNSGDIYILKYNSSGLIQWGTTIGGINDDFSSGISLDGSTNIYISGNYFSPNMSVGTSTIVNAGGGDVYVARLGGTPQGLINQDLTSNFIIYPNPVTSSGQITIKQFDKNQTVDKIEIYNAIGQLMFSQKISSMKQTIETNLSKGIYIYFLSNSVGQTLKNKLIIE